MPGLLTFLRTSQAMGTIELTGLVIMATTALGQTAAMHSVMSRTMVALVLKRSARVIPALRGTPAAITTRFAPVGLKV